MLEPKETINLENESNLKLFSNKILLQSLIPFI